MKATLQKVCLIISTLIFIAPVHAAWYQVEVIMFENLDPSADGELWYENPGLPDRSNSIELITVLADDEDLSIQFEDKADKESSRATPELIPYLQLNEDKLKMEGIYRVLKLSREYRPLMHVGWQQPGLTPTSARSVHIQKFEEVEDSTANGEQSAVEDSYEVPDLIFDGTIKLRISRFLHVDVDVAYFPDLLSIESEMNNQDKKMFGEQRADYVRLRESRKIKLNEIHYFDHPVFGVILRVSRLSLN